MNVNATTTRTNTQSTPTSTPPTGQPTMPSLLAPKSYGTNPQNESCCDGAPADGDVIFYKEGGDPPYPGKVIYTNGPAGRCITPQNGFKSLSEAERRISEQLRLLAKSDSVFANLPAVLIECLDIMLDRGGSYNSDDFGVWHQNYRHGDLQAFLVASRPVFRLDAIFQNNGKNLPDHIAKDPIHDTINGHLIWGCLRKGRQNGETQDR